MKNDVRKMINGEEYTFCNKCKQWKPISKFSIDNTFLHGNRGGLCRECKDCQRKRYYENRNKKQTFSRPEIAVRAVYGVCGYAQFCESPAA